jgi:hypothetical protein
MRETTPKAQCAVDTVCLTQQHGALRGSAFASKDTAAQTHEQVHAVPMVRARQHLREHEQLLATGAHAEEGNL